MQVAQILKAKNQVIVTTTAETSVIEIARTLKRERIGAVVVTGSGGSLDGILSERDIVHGLSEHGADLLSMRVADLMTRTVITCGPENNVEDVMREMTSCRIRHLPVVADGALVGIVSIGDVVKNRVDELEMESSMLRNYLVSR